MEHRKREREVEKEKKSITRETLKRKRESAPLNVNLQVMEKISREYTKGTLNYLPQV